MKEKTKHFYHTIREICQGSGKISLLSIAIITTIIYGVFFGLENQNALPLLLGTLNKDSFESAKAYLDYVTSSRIDVDLTTLVSVITTIILLIPPTLKLKNNTFNKLIPISAKTKVGAFMCVIIITTLISSFLVEVYNYLIIECIRNAYIPEITSIRESMGILYNNRAENMFKLFDLNFSYSPKGIQHLISIMILSLVLSTIVIVMNLYFNKYGIVKGIVSTIILVYLAFSLRRLITKNNSAFIGAPLYTYEIVYYIYFPLLFLCFLIAFYYLLKQKES